MKVLVVDDEPLARGRLARMLMRVPDVERVDEADGADAALRSIAAARPDLVFLDIQMPQVDGLALAERAGMPLCIFTTAHLEYAAEAFDLDAVDYLAKPVRQERLEEALARTRRRLAAGGRAGAPPEGDFQLVVHEAGKVRFVDARRATFFRAVDKYTELMVDGRVLLVRESLDTLEERLGCVGFVRVHRASLVRLDAVVELRGSEGGAEVKLSSGACLPVSRRLLPELRQRLGLRHSSR